ncbi:MAG: TetR/AcrR family transcriptional regulator [Gammaproteobacteria bacterium]|nr:TetR/AcrR family transcriptional regulator [Gammaproteobacteria bacterium]
MASNEDTRGRIVDTARALFHRKGFSAIGVAEICNEAEVTKGSFYHFFDSKHTLLEDVIAENTRCLLQGLRTLDEQSITGREKLVAQLHGTGVNARRQKKSGAVLGCNLGNIANELAAYDTVASQSVRRAFNRWLRVIRKQLEQAIADGSMPADTDIESTALSLLAVIQGISTIGRTFDKPSQLDSIIAITEQKLLPQTDAG